MIRVVRDGIYSLVETKRSTKILILDQKESYAWINAADIGEILVAVHANQPTDHILSIGSYRLYEVADEEELTDLQHLELHVGNMTWQGYLLPHGLPTKEKTKNRIIPTNEVITKATL